MVVRIQLWPLAEGHQEAEGHQLWHEDAGVWRVVPIQDPTKVTRSVTGRKAGEQVARWGMRGLLEGLERVRDLEPCQEGYNQIKECSAKTGVDEMGRRSIDERQSKTSRYSIQSNCCSYWMERERSRVRGPSGPRRRGAEDEEAVDPRPQDHYQRSPYSWVYSTWMPKV